MASISRSSSAGGSPAFLSYGADETLTRARYRAGTLSNGTPDLYQRLGSLARVA
jgi:hypothetical protein